MINTMNARQYMGVNMLSNMPSSSSLTAVPINYILPHYYKLMQVVQGNI